MELSEAIYGRRSVRSYLPEEVPREVLDTLIDAGRWAPSAGCAQPWAFVVVDEPERIKRLKSIAPGMFSEPAFVIAVCADRQAAVQRMGPQGEILALMDVCMAAQNISLAAHAAGLGTCIIRSFHQKAAAVLLGCPDGVVPELLIAGGRADRIPRAPNRRALDQIRHFNRWGQK
ncbi:MAG: nitroreductase family protein [Bacillota bacterium]